MANISNFLSRSQAASEAAGQQLSESISQGLFDLTGGEVGSASPARLEKIQNSKIAGFQAEFATSLKGGEDYVEAYSKLLSQLTSIGADTTEVEKALGAFSVEKERDSLQTERDKPTTTTGDAEKMAKLAKYSEFIKNFGEVEGNDKFLEWLQQGEEALAASGTSEGTNKYVEEVGKAKAGEDMALIDNASTALQGIAKTNEVLELLEGGDQEVITGFGAQQFLNIERFGKAIGYVKGERVEKTQQLEALLGSDVFPMIKALGIGARGLDTVAEREFLMKVMTGTITMDKEALKELTGYRQKYYRLVIEEYNKQLNSGKFGLYEKALSTDDFKFKLEKITAPETYVKPAVAVYPEGTQKGIADDGTQLFLYPDGTYHLIDGTLVEIE